MNPITVAALSALVGLLLLASFTVGRWAERDRRAVADGDAVRGLYVCCLRCGEQTAPNYAQMITADRVIQVMYAPDAPICVCRATTAPRIDS